MYQITIEENIKRILKTSKFTKTLRPTFGLDRYIDKRMDLEQISYLKDDIFEQLSKYEPRIEVLEIIILPNKNKTELSIVYKEKDKITIFVLE